MTALTNSNTGQHLADFSGSSIISAFNTTKKVCIPIEGRPDEGLLLTERKSLAVKTSSGSTSAAKHNRDDAVVKVVARPEISEFPGTRAKNISPGYLKNLFLCSCPNR